MPLCHLPAHNFKVILSLKINSFILFTHSHENLNYIFINVNTNETILILLLFFNKLHKSYWYFDGGWCNPSAWAQYKLFYSILFQCGRGIAVFIEAWLVLFIRPGKSMTNDNKLEKSFHISLSPGAVRNLLLLMLTALHGGRSAMCHCRPLSSLALERKYDAAGVSLNNTPDAK